MDLTSLRKPKHKAKKKRDYGTLPDGSKKPSVTEIMKLVDLDNKQGALMGWAHKLGREGRSMNERDLAARKGSCAHDLVAAHYDPESHDLSEYTIDEVEEAMPNAKRVIAEIDRLGWRVLHVERVLHADTHAGTCDMIAVCPTRGPLIVDLKTGSGVYRETILQLGAYAAMWRHECMANGDDASIAIQGAVIHAHPGKDLAIHDVSPTALLAGEHAFYRLLEIRAVHAQIRFDAKKETTT